ncbi:hypothetical protein EJ06DRAFT_558239 [Trichodelitschia bisporula]|uniref:Cell death in tomato 1 n=1 Tax=Trichodelitschia bisporula TaxID=703511 RepID=A0A6G1HR68_9PEZI|nr:hypothetical protein EJ06DRAFT_558239 [Trichodelitschia bisporula]
MKFSIATAAVALSAAASAAPTAPATFAIQITATIAGTPTSMYLGKDGAGTGVADLKDAESCTISPSAQLLCGGKAIGAAPAMGGYVDMAPLAPVSGAAAMTDGFSVDANNVLHWKSVKFPSLPQVGKLIVEKQGGEAQWGLFKSTMLTRGAVKLYSQLGCPGGTHSGLHDELVVGSIKVVPL